MPLSEHLECLFKGLFMKRYSKSPLPFLGQKRNWLRDLEKIDFSGLTVIDLFGGSGLVSHSVKAQSADTRVIWNDYDNFKGRLEMIAETEELRGNLLSVGLEKAKRVNEEGRAQTQEIIDKHLEKFGRVDWITVSSWLLFAANYAHDYDDLMGRTWYYQVVKNPLSADGYLEGVERRSCDFRELISEFENDPKVIFIADPPYIMTNQSGYAAKTEEFFRLKDGVELIKSLHDRRALLFSSPKSETDSLLEVFTPAYVERKEFSTSISTNRIREYLYLINMRE